LHWDVEVDVIFELLITAYFFKDIFIVILDLSVILFHDISEMFDGELLQNFLIIFVDIIDVALDTLFDLGHDLKVALDRLLSLDNAFGKGVVQFMVLLFDVLDDVGELLV
jgi:hypothetical protein